MLFVVLAGCKAESDDDAAPFITTPTTRAGFAEPELIPGGTQTAFQSGDLFLTGQLFATQKGPAALLVHSSTADMRSLFPLAQRLAEDGLIVLAVDLRGYGQSQGEKDPSTFAADIAAAIEFLDGRGNRPIAVVGVEGGGTAAVMAAVDSAAVGAVAVIGSAPTFGPLDATGAARSLRKPAAVFSSGGDGGDQLARLIAGADLRRSPQPRNVAADTQLHDEVTAFVNATVNRPE